MMYELEPGSVLWFFFPFITYHFNIINCDKFKNYTKSAFAEDFLT